MHGVGSREAFSVYPTVNSFKNFQGLFVQCISLDVGTSGFRLDLTFYQEAPSITYSQARSEAL